MDIKKDYYIKDPVHKEIDFKKDKWILELLECDEVIRLEGIYQLGVSYKIFPSASHNRLMHSLGTFQVAKKFADFFEDKISVYQRKLFLASALLHDIGHGPFSHVFEKISKINHEEVTKKMILNPYGNIYRVLVKNEIKPMDLIDVYEGNSKYEWISKLISSNLDVDRIDYMLRDSYFLGTHYGTIDVDFLIERSFLIDNDIYFSDKAINVIESFLLSRYYMHKDIFSNKNTYIYEWVLELILLRLKDLKSQFEIHRNNINYFDLYGNLVFNEEQLDLDKYIKYTDWNFMAFIDSLRTIGDKILNGLINTFINHKGVISITYSDQTLNKVHLKSEQIRNIDKKYLFKVIDRSQKMIYYPGDKNIINIINVKTNKLYKFNNDKFNAFTWNDDIDNKFILVNTNLIN